MKNKYSKCLVIDTSYMPRSIINTERAFVISMKGNADVTWTHPVKFGLVNPELEIFKPSVIKVRSYVNVPYRKVALSRDNIFKRDNYECVYCGESGERSKLTLDHVVPQSKGGPNTWNNLVTSCKKCNNEKADLTLEEYGKKIPVPKRPHSIMLLKKTKYIPEEWRDFLFF